MSQVNLLPPEVLQRIKTRRLTILIGVVGAAVVALLFMLWGAQRITLGQIELEIGAQNQTNGDLQGQVLELLPFQELQDEVTARQALVAAALRNEVAWSSILRDIQLEIPPQMALTQFSGEVSSSATAEEEGGPAIIGSLTFSGTAEGTLRLARWLNNLDTVPGWANAWLSNAQQSAEGTNLYTFSSTVDLLEDVVTPRGSVAAEAEGEAA